MTQVGKISILAFSYYSRENEVNQGEGEIYRGKLELENAKEEGAEEEKWGLGGGDSESELAKQRGMSSVLPRR